MYLLYWASWSCSKDLAAARGVGATRVETGAGVRAAEALGCGATLEGADAIFGAGGTTLAAGAGAGAGPFIAEGVTLEVGG